MSLYQCMNKIAEIGGILNPLNGCMLRIFHCISTNLTAELLNAVLQDYCELFKITIKVLVYEGNIYADTDPTRVSDLASLAPNNQEGQERCVFVVYNPAQQLFAPVCVRRDDGNVALFFEHNEWKIIEENVLDYIRQRRLNNNIIINQTNFNNRNTTDPGYNQTSISLNSNNIQDEPIQMDSFDSIDQCADGMISNILSSTFIEYFSSG